MVTKLPVEHGRLFAKLRWLVIFNRCATLGMVKFWAKVMAVYR